MSKVNWVQCRSGFDINDFSYKKLNTKDSLFYCALLSNDKNFNNCVLKVGTTEQSLGARFKQYDYSYIKILFVIEINNWMGAYQLEDLTKAYLRFKDGFRWIKNDRFYFDKLEELPLFDTINHQFGTVKFICNNKKISSMYCEMDIFTLFELN